MAVKKKIENNLDEEIKDKEVLTEEEEIKKVSDEETSTDNKDKDVKENHKKEEKHKEEPKFKMGDIVFISKEADADLNGFKLFPQYKKYTYTVEAYDAKSDVYTLRRLNLSLKLKGELILAPNERAHDALNKKQF